MPSYNTMIATPSLAMKSDFEVYTTSGKMDDENAHWTEVYRGSHEDTAIESANFWDRRQTTIMLSRQAQRRMENDRYRTEIESSGVTHSDLTKGYARTAQTIEANVAEALAKL